MTKSLENRIEHLLPLVQKPGRYTGGELNQIVKNWKDISTKVAFAFPDIYDLGMSNHGLAMLYHVVNQRNDALAERTFLPWVDMEKIMREEDIPLFSLESKKPLHDFDILGISIPYETLYTNTLNLLDLAKIPLFSKDRTEKDPLVIAGGHSTMNPEPMHLFIDAFIIGEGEEVINDIVDCFANWKKNGESRNKLLESLSQIWGVYIPSLYKVSYLTNGTLDKVTQTYEKANFPIRKRIVANLGKPMSDFIVPYIDTVHNRISIEIMRGCTRGCRFCHAGMITRPVRERSVEDILETIEEGITKTGYEEVGLLSLSSSDYSYVLELVKKINEKFEGKNLSISLPSLRIESFSVELMDALSTTRRSGFTLAPEAGTERMRNIINKPMSENIILETVKEIYSRGWHTIKLYYMIGHPGETLEDVRGIVELSKKIREVGYQLIGRKAKVNVGVSTFVPKPWTTFQWAACNTPEQIEEKQDILRNELRGWGLKLNWNDPHETMLEAALSRGDRRVSEAVYLAWKHGAKFDAWHEFFNFKIWKTAFEEAGLAMEFYSQRVRYEKEIFPWEHISPAIRKSFLLEDYKMSPNGETREDCRNQCYACGILPLFNDIRKETPDGSWKCPPVKGQDDVK